MHLKCQLQEILFNFPFDPKFGHCNLGWNTQTQIISIGDFVNFLVMFKESDF